MLCAPFLYALVACNTGAAEVHLELQYVGWETPRAAPRLEKVLRVPVDATVLAALEVSTKDNTSFMCTARIGGEALRFSGKVVELADETGLTGQLSISYSVPDSQGPDLIVFSWRGAVKTSWGERCILTALADRDSRRAVTLTATKVSTKSNRGAMREGGRTQSTRGTREASRRGKRAREGQRQSSGAPTDHRVAARGLPHVGENEWENERTERGGEREEKGRRNNVINGCLLVRPLKSAWDGRTADGRDSLRTLADGMELGQKPSAKGGRERRGR
jgi:hypothetical protein